MISEIYQMYNILESFLGSAKNGFDGKCLQLQFPCPNCIANKGENEMLKYNLEVNLSKGVYHCWSCSANDNTMSGSIFKLIKRYGNEKLLQEYRKAIISLRNSELYKIKFTLDDFKLDDDTIKKTIDFPLDFIPITKAKTVPKEILEYLNSRNIHQDIINKYNIGYTRLCSKEQWQWSFRIILPSYDKYGELNFCTGRDYTNKAKNKYYNTKVNKKDIIFNEDQIQWDADITLVEGPFDHIVVPNSIPLLGKKLSEEDYIYRTIIEKANANVNVFLDGDAVDDCKKIYNLLNSHGNLHGKVRYIPCREKNDPSDLYTKGGFKAILKHLNSASIF